MLNEYRLQGVDLKPDPGLRPDLHSALAECRRSCRLEAAAAEALGRARGVDPRWVWVSAFALLLHRLTGQGQGAILFCSVERPLWIVAFDAPAARDFSGWLDQIARSFGERDALAANADRLPLIGIGDGAARPEHTNLFLSLTSDDLVAVYSLGLYGADRVQCLLDQLLLLVRQTAADPSRDAYSYSLVTEAARRILPNPVADLGHPEYRPVAELILEHTTSRPNETAVEHNGRSWSYRALDDVSADVARRLRGHGVAAGDSVAVTGQRCFGFVAAMLGVWRSGGVLVNIDPALPEQRRQSMMSAAGVRHVVHVTAEPSSLQAGVTVALLPDGEFASVSSGDDRTPLPSLAPEQPAYIFFTSGSTGTPKAVKGLHAGLSHFLSWQRAEFEIGPHDRASQLTALSFDVILRDTFLVLASGGTLCIPRESDVLEPRRIVGWLDAERVSVLHLVPSLARLWLGSVSGPHLLRSLEHVFFAGEPLTDALARQWRDTFSPDASIVNLYGPTETTLAKCYYRLPTALEPGIQPIGSPLPNTQLLVLNPAKALCGLHEPGEIVIRTPFRTLGYLNNPEAHARAFVSNPWTDDSQDVVYLTGDGGSYRPDGTLAIHGRLDNQVKIRGIRVEPGEVEAALAQSDLVREAVVLACQDPSGEKALAAYVVPSASELTGAQASFVSGLRTHLRERLPEAMVPTSWVVLDALPLGPNGKINKSALPPPDRATSSVDSGAEQRTKLESELAAIWCHLLHLDHVSLDDDFFDVGGHSLLAVRLTQRIRQELRCRCTLSMLFRTRTIRSLARELELDDPARSEATVLPLQSQGQEPGLFCLCGLHLYQELADHLAPDIPVYGVFLPFEEQLLDEIQSEVPRIRSIEELAAAYVAVIRAKQPDGPYLLAGVSFGGVVAYEVGHQLRQTGAQVALVAMLDTVLPNALGRDWLQWFVDRLSEARREGIGAFKVRLRRKLVRWLARGADPEAADGDAALRALRTRRQEFYHAAEVAYRVPPCVDPVLLVRAEDQGFHHSDIRDHTYGWGAAAAALEIIDLPGDHLGILETPHVAALATTLRKRIERAVSIR